LEVDEWRITWIRFAIHESGKKEERDYYEAGKEISDEFWFENGKTLTLK